MKIIELEWVMSNKEKLSDDEIKHLNSFDLFNQYESGTLQQNGLKMIEALGLVIGLYEKYAKY